VTRPGLHGQVLELGGPDNLTFNQVAVIVQQATGCRGTVRHIPRPALRAMAWLAATIKPRWPARPEPRSPWTPSTADPRCAARGHGRTS
jgi:uncharacterized protein YbjT (DUF2867 family)